MDDHTAGKVVVNLISRLNKCGVISLRFDVQLKDLGKTAESLAPIPCTDNLSWHHGPGSSKAKTHGTENSVILLLQMYYIHANKVPQWKKKCISLSLP